MSNRRQAREYVLQALYAFELSGDDIRHIIDTIVRPQLKDDDAVLRFAESLLIRTIDQKEASDAIISEHTENWDLTRIALVDHLLLRMAICELLSFEDIPPKVSINEAIEVAKRYSTPRSGQFINGILDAILLSLREEDRLKKSGRGLVGMQSISNGSLSD